MKIPSKVKIKKGIYYKVVWQEVIRDDIACMGLCDPNERIIYLKLGMSDTNIAKSFLHELCHALEFTYKEIELSHKTIYAIDSAVYRLLKLNKWL